MTRGSSFENPLERAMNKGTIGATLKPTEQESASESRERKTSKRQVVKTSPPEQTDPDMKLQQTVYLRRKIIRATKHTAVDQDTDISSVVEKALEEYFDRHKITY